MPIAQYLSDCLIVFGLQMPIYLCIFSDDTQSSFI